MEQHPDTDMKRFEVFHQRCLRKSLRFKLNYFVSIADVLKTVNIAAVDLSIRAARLRWHGHVVRKLKDIYPTVFWIGYLSMARSRKHRHGSCRTAGIRQTTVWGLICQNKEILCHAAPATPTTGRPFRVKVQGSLNNERLKPFLQIHWDRSSLVELFEQELFEMSTSTELGKSPYVCDLERALGGAGSPPSILLLCEVT